MPGELNLDSRYELTKLTSENFKPSQFLRRMCAVELHKTKTLILQQNKKTRLIASYVADDDENGKALARDGFERLVVTAPTVHPWRDLSKRDVETAAKADGIVTYGGQESSEKIKFQSLMNDALELRQSIERREEQQIVEAITTGKVDVKVDDNLMRTINLNIPSANLSPAASGDKFDANGSNPILYLLNQKRLVAKNGGGNVGLTIMGNDAFDAFIQNDAVKEYMDKRHMMFGEIDPKDTDPEGITRAAHILGMDIITYDEFFYDEKQKKDLNLIPKDSIIMIGNGAGFKMHYGAIADGTDGTLNVCQSYVYTWIKNGKSKILEEESSPLFVPMNGAAIISRKVV